MICGACGVENRAGRKFCAECGARLESYCPACGAANGPGEKFCGECGAALTDAAQAPAPSVSERRLVTILFADLVGFTTVSEHRDPEDIRDLLSRYFERCRALMERYGGTVEKFIGDAVMAVWGSPVAREDDAERAVRAALGLTRAVSALGEEVGIPDLRVRAGVLTGRAAVDVAAEDEGMVVGDTVNTASRLQAIAAPGTVLVDEVTRRASEAAIAYEDAGMHQLKGREQPVHAWVALSVVAGAGGARRGVGIEPSFVGRDRELQTVIASSDASAADRRARLVTVLGEAGTGKSRLLWEFFKYVDGISDVRWWHEGRCLSYGEGVAYWALAEMVRARARILEEESPVTAREKLHAAVVEHVSDERERRLVEPRLAHLLGLEKRTATEAADLFSGWRLFFERMAQTGPVILAFEDLQWADSGLLDFIDYLLEWSAEHPIFILALGRSEVEPRRAGWGTVVRLEPLGTASMQTLMESVASALPEALSARIMQSADGVPLYAVETVRMLRDRGVLVEDGQRYVVSGAPADLEVPETLQALIAARLDNLDAAERGLLQDAAVLGMSFAPAALVAVSGRPPAAVQRMLEGLVSRQVLGHYDDPRLSEHGQYHFLQSLVQTIALGSLPRRHLKARHLAAAEYLRATSEDATDIAEVLSSHYLAAVETDPDARDADVIRALARETLATAGHRAVSLALGVKALRYFEQAAAFADDELQRAQLLGEAGVAAARAAERGRARTLLGDAIRVLDASGRSEEAARTRALLADVLMADNRLEDAGALIDAARSTIADQTVLAELAARRARVAFLAGDTAQAIAEADLALDTADRRALNPIVADAAMTKATALAYQQRIWEADALMLLSLKIALEEDITEAALRAYFNLAELRVLVGAPEEAALLLERGLELARQRGNRAWERDLLAQRVGIHAFRGEWDEALAASDTLRSSGQDDSARLAALFESLIFAARGDDAELEACLGQQPSASEWHELALGESISRAIALRATGNLSEAAPMLAAAAPEFMCAGGLTAAFYLGEIVDALVETEQIPELEDVLGRTDHPRYPLTQGEFERGRAVLHSRRGELAEAQASLARSVADLRKAGNPFALARALLDEGRSLLELGRTDQEVASLQEARGLFIQLRAKPWLARTERALAPAAIIA